MTPARWLLLWAACVGVGCSDPAPRPSDTPQDADASQDADAPQDAPQDADAPDASQDADAPEDADAPDIDLWADLPSVPEGMVRVRVSLDGRPSPDTRVVQGGTSRVWRTDARGTVTAQLSEDVEGELALIASHPEARIRAAVFDELEEPGGRDLLIELARFSDDNPRAPFSDPGEPARRPNTSQCSHCHQTIGDAWFDSPHRSAASNPRVHDLYAGVASELSDEGRCAEAEGRWGEGLEPGTGQRVMRCYVGAGALPALNPACADEGCDGRASNTGGCADCHAPEMPGRLGGRDLLDARDMAYRYGVACAACHQAERIEMDAPPGTAGRLKLVRPGERASIALGAGGFLPLTFGPDHDSPNPRMGSVQRDHFRDGRLCAGCHQHEGPPLVEGAVLDPGRWPQGRLPFQTTYEEWRLGALGTSTRCPSCHMPPDPQVSNSADLQRFHDAEVGVQGGWPRPAGAVRQHSWLGPRAPGSQMLQLAAALFVRRKEVLEGGRLWVELETRNVGAGHAIPTGEAMRALYLRVEAWCGERPLVAVGGDAIPAIGGALERRTKDQGWGRWSDARVGDRVRVVARPGGFYDYAGVEPFIPQRMTPAQRGLPIERVVGEVEVLALSEGGEATFSAPLPDGDEAYLVRDEPGRAPFLAGSPGFAFARVLLDAQGRAQAPHFVAVDVASDNRLMPQAAWTSSHEFDAAACPDPQVRAQLWYRPYPRWMADEKRWEVQDALMASVRR